MGMPLGRRIPFLGAWIQEIAPGCLGPLGLFLFWVFCCTLSHGSRAPSLFLRCLLPTLLFLVAWAEEWHRRIQCTVALPFSAVSTSSLAISRVRRASFAYSHLR